MGFFPEINGSNAIENKLKQALTGYGDIYLYIKYLSFKCLQLI